MCLVEAPIIAAHEQQICRVAYHMHELGSSSVPLGDLLAATGIRQLA
jgi:hypothetical protein